MLFQFHIIQTFIGVTKHVGGRVGGVGAGWVDACKHAFECVECVWQCGSPHPGQVPHWHAKGLLTRIPMWRVYLHNEWSFQEHRRIRMAFNREPQYVIQT